MVSLDQSLRAAGYTRLEGHTGQEPRETAVLSELVTRTGIRRVMEIGFNAGHSANTFLSANRECELVSFDLGDHKYMTHAKQWIDEQYPGRHTLIEGDSTVTVRDHDGGPYDLIFIDGGHQLDVARQDIANCHRLAHSESVVIMDDVVYGDELRPFWAFWVLGPTQAWREAISAGLVMEDGHHDLEAGRGISWGRYVIR